ncbi:MAG: hypothetical protein KGL52_02830 [Rhodospirillales bacterium]|nr:hypothetical protein [Rhodospirillales bacterium]
MRLPASVAAAAVLLLAGCQAQVATPPPPPLPMPPSAGLPPPLQAREPARWHFASARGACTALAIGRTARLRITVAPRRGVQFTVLVPAGFSRQGPTGLGALRFAGSAGGWTADAQIGPGRIAVTLLPLNDQALGRLVLLLGGGTLTPIGAGATLPTLILAPAGIAGRRWFACARGFLS